MQIKKFRIFDASGTIIYGGICAFFTCVDALAIRYNYFVTQSGIPIGGWVAMIVATIMGFAISAYRFMLREKFVATIQGYTEDGTGIVKYDEHISADAPKLNDAITRISQIQLEVINFWCSEKNESIYLFLDYMNGGMLSFTPEKIDMTAHAPTGPLAYMPETKWAVGATQGNWSTVMMNQNTNWETVQKEIGHEFGHQCLSALGIDPLDHHAEMRKAGFNY